MHQSKERRYLRQREYVKCRRASESEERKNKRLAKQQQCDKVCLWLESIDQKRENIIIGKKAKIKALNNESTDLYKTRV